MKFLMGVPTTDHIELSQYEIEGLRNIGVEIDTVSYGSRKRRESTLQKVFTVLKTIYSIRHALANAQYDLIYLNSAFASRGLIRDVITTLALWGSDVPIFIKMHGSEVALLERTDWYARVLRRILFKRVSAFGVLSSEELVNFRKAGAEEHTLFQVKNVVNPDVYEKESEFKKNLGLDSKSPIILFVSRFIASKGLIDLIRAGGIVRENGYDVNIICVGDGPEFMRCEAAVNHLGLRESVKFLGFLPETETKAFYANADIVVLPTWHDEGFPMAVFQAVAAGVPIITTRIRAAADYLREPDNCLWVEPRDPTMLAEKIQQLLDDPILASQMGRNNAKNAVNYNKESVAQEFLQCYRKIKKLKFQQ